MTCLAMVAILRRRLARRFQGDDQRRDRHRFLPILARRSRRHDLLRHRFRMEEDPTFQGFRDRYRREHAFVIFCAIWMVELIRGVTTIRLAESLS